MKGGCEHSLIYTETEIPETDANSSIHGSWSRLVSVLSSVSEARRNKVLVSDVALAVVVVLRCVVWLRIGSMMCDTSATKLLTSFTSFSARPIWSDEITSNSSKQGHLKASHARLSPRRVFGRLNLFRWIYNIDILLPQEILLRFTKIYEIGQDLAILPRLKMLK